VRRIDARCMNSPEQYEIRCECPDCRQVAIVALTSGHPSVAGSTCPICNGPSLPLCPCGGELVKEGTLW
jgi:hypothetical protein